MKLNAKTKAKARSVGVEVFCQGLQNKRNGKSNSTRLGLQREGHGAGAVVAARNWGAG